MKIIIATGIYPPDIGGPATYAHELAMELLKRGVEVAVVTYAHRKFQIPPNQSLRSGSGQANSKLQTNPNIQNQYSKTTNYQLPTTNSFPVVSVSRAGGPILRWWRYARALRRHAADADVVIAFSSVSVGMPLLLARLKKPKKILRLGGDFFWERYTDRGGVIGLQKWYTLKVLSIRYQVLGMGLLLRKFDHIVFSTRFQEEIYEEYYKSLAKHSVIENAFPNVQTRTRTQTQTPNSPFRLLFMGRFVGFKNLPFLLRAMRDQRLTAKNVTLTLVGDGPLLPLLTTHYSLPTTHVTFLPPAHGEEKLKIFADHDLLIIPSITEISPNVALEARATGLPVLLTKETGLSASLAQGMVIRDLSTPDAIVAAIGDVMAHYDAIAREATAPPPQRGWSEVADEWMQLCQTCV